jgi:hypothetical protein
MRTPSPSSPRHARRRAPQECIDCWCWCCFLCGACSAPPRIEADNKPGKHGRKYQPAPHRSGSQKRKNTAMRGIETAFWGVLGKDPEPKTSKTGKAFATMSVAVTAGQADDGTDVSQWLREGSLTLNTWETAAKPKPASMLRPGSARRWRASAGTVCGKTALRLSSPARPFNGKQAPRYEFDDQLGF